MKDSKKRGETYKKSAYSSANRNEEGFVIKQPILLLIQTVYYQNSPQPSPLKTTTTTIHEQPTCVWKSSVVR
jgi:hypothetical protein